MLFVTTDTVDSRLLVVVYANSAAHAHQIRALERGETIEDADVSFDLAAWLNVDPNKLNDHMMLVWERIEYGEVEEDWDYEDWNDHGSERAYEKDREGATIAYATPTDFGGCLVPAKA